jgi:hypothetical protein
MATATSPGCANTSTWSPGTVEQIREKYIVLGTEVFERTFLRQVVLRDKYDEKNLIAELKTT